MTLPTLVRQLLGVAAVMVAVGGAGPARAHMATERYIPIGQSPGVSHKLTVIGKIEAVDPQRKSITLAGPSGLIVVGVEDKTRIWLDRTKMRRTNLDGGFDDLVPGRVVEVKFRDQDRKRSADWVKVEAKGR
jgi:hypothetical protein